MSPWRWSPAKSSGIWQYGASWLRPFVAAAPWLSALTVLALFKVTSDAISAERGVLFELPDADVGTEARAKIVAIAMPAAHETMVFFDDARYMPGDPVSAAALAERFAEAAARDDEKVLWVLADRRIPGGDLMRLAGIARRSGLRKALFAEKKADGGGE